MRHGGHFCKKRAILRPKLATQHFFMKNTSNTGRWVYEKGGWFPAGPGSFGGLQTGCAGPAFPITLSLNRALRPPVPIRGAPRTAAALFSNLSGGPVGHHPFALVVRGTVEIKSPLSLGAHPRPTVQPRPRAGLTGPVGPPMPCSTSNLSGGLVGPVRSPRRRGPWLGSSRPFH